MTSDTIQFIEVTTLNNTVQSLETTTLSICFVLCLIKILTYLLTYY